MCEFSLQAFIVPPVECARLNLGRSRRISFRGRQVVFKYESRIPGIQFVEVCNALDDPCNGTHPVGLSRGDTPPKGDNLLVLGQDG